MYTLKKSLGQHFLKDEKIIQKILHALTQDPFKNLLEVGPGAGALTRHLIHLPGVDLKAIEIDREKTDFLLNTYPALEGKLINGDFLLSGRPFNEPFTVIGNFPYNISTQILFKILEWKEYVPCVIGMFQKEVAERVASGKGSKEYGVLSVLMQYYYDIEYLFDVGSESFTPPPKVQSGVIRLKAIKNPVPVKSESSFRTLVKTAFNQRRKTMRNAARNLFDEETLKDGIFSLRAEALGVNEFAALTFRMRNGH